MNWAQFKNPVSHTRLADAVVASWSLIQEMAGSSPFNNKYFLSLKHLAKAPIGCVQIKIVQRILLQKLSQAMGHFQRLYKF